MSPADVRLQVGRESRGESRRRRRDAEVDGGGCCDGRSILWLHITDGNPVDEGMVRDVGGLRQIAGSATVASAEAGMALIGGSSPVYKSPTQAGFDGVGRQLPVARWRAADIVQLREDRR